MLNARKLEKDVETIESSIEEELKEKLLSLSKEEFIEYFESLIDKYYKVLFTFEANYSKYYEESKKKYKLIKEIKSIMKEKYSLNDFENAVRLRKAEEIAYSFMNELYFMEESYSNIIYHNALQEVLFFNSTFKDLLKLYKNNPSEELLSVIGNTLTGIGIFFKGIEKLPSTEATTLEEIEEPVEFKKEHYENLSEEEKAEVPESFKFNVYKVPVFSLELKVQVEKFYSILEDLEKILPEDVVNKFRLKINSSEKIDFLNYLLETKAEEESEEDIYNIVAYLDYIKTKNNKGYLYEHIEEWS